MLYRADGGKLSAILCFQSSAHVQTDDLLIGRARRFPPKAFEVQFRRFSVVARGVYRSTTLSRRKQISYVVHTFSLVCFRQLVKYLVA